MTKQKLTDKQSMFVKERQGVIDKMVAKYVIDNQGAFGKAYTDMLIYGTGTVFSDGQEFYSKSIVEMLKQDTTTIG